MSTTTRPRRLVTPLVLLLTLALILAACGDGDADPAQDADAVDETGVEDDADTDPAEADADADPVTIEMWFNGTPDEHGVLVEEFVNEYEAMNPHITIDWEMLAWGAYQERVAAAAAGGTLPDIVFSFSTVMPAFAAQGMLANLDDYLDRDLFLEEALQLGTWDDEWTGIPFWFTSRPLTYRKDLAAEAGLDPDNPPATWDDLRQWAEALTVEEGGQVERLGYTVRQGVSFAIPDLFWTTLYSNGGRMMDESGLQVTLDTQEALEAAELLQDLFECCDQPGAIEAENIGLGQGLVAMLLSNHGVRAWQSEFPDLVEQDAAGFTVYPAGPSATEDTGVTTLGANIISVTSQSDNPREAAEFLAWLTADADNATRFAGLGQDIPGAAAAQDHPYFDESPYVGMYRDLLEEARVATIKHPGVGDFQRIITTHLDSLTLDGADPRAVLDAMAAELQAVVDESGIPVEEVVQ